MPIDPVVVDSRASISDRIKAWVDRLPHVRNLAIKVRQYEHNACYPPGHYYSPIVDVDRLRARHDAIWRPGGAKEIPGVDLRPEAQIALMEQLATYAAELPFGEEPVPGLRYHFTNRWFAHSDGILLYALLRQMRPKRVVEVGSGWSSALMLDVNDRFFEGAIRFTFIEPNPERLLGLISAADARTALLQQEVQEVPLRTFDALEAGDILFIDSSHVIKTGSDVAHLLFEVLPRLKPGVLVHFHDVFDGFEYPEEWVYGGRNWNEDHALRAFLMYNTAFRVLLFPHHLHRHHPKAFAAWPLAYHNHGGSLWLERC